MCRAGTFILLASCALACLARGATVESGTCDSCQETPPTIEDIGELIYDDQAEIGDEYLGLLQKSAQKKSHMVGSEDKGKQKTTAPLAGFSLATICIIAVVALTFPFCLSRAPAPEDKPTTKNMWILLGSLQLIIAVGFYILGQPVANYYKDPAQNTQLYNYYVGVALMMLVGFGYLMTFNHWYGLGAVGFTMLITCLGVQWAVLVEPLFANGFKPFNIDLMALLNGNFAAAAFLISFGGIIGKVGPSQLVLLTFLETIFYSANKQWLLIQWLNIADCGGTIIIHMFGAFFGLAVAFVLGAPSEMIREQNNAVSDIFAFVGTVFLWLYWPSFVAGGLPPGTIEAETAITNTVLALLGSTIATFVYSAFFSGKMLRPVDIQNATLAGGVSIGAVANLNIGPFGALLIGLLAGELSTIGYCHIQDALKDGIDLHDTCGIHNLHGMPSVLGGIASVLVPLYVEQGNAGRLGNPWNQLLGVVLTILVAVGTGTITALAMKALKNDGEALNDSMYWEVAEDFDKEFKEDRLIRRRSSYVDVKAIAAKFSQ